MADDGHVGRAVPFSQALEIVVEDGVEGPVKCVLYGPMAADGSGGLLGGKRSGRDEVSRFGA